MMATEAVQFALSSLWSCIPDFPVEEAAEGIVRGLEVEASARTEVVARKAVSTFASVPAGGPSTGDAAHPEAQPEGPSGGGSRWPVGPSSTLFCMM